MIKFYEIEDAYIDYLHKVDNKVLLSKEYDRVQTRKYIGVVMEINNFKYFIPLSSYKADTYDKMYESVSLIKIKKYAVLRINNMIPASEDVINKIDFKNISDENYKYLLMSEYRIIKKRESEIRKNARIVYSHRTNISNSNKPLYKICCDFNLLETMCDTYSVQSKIAITETEN